MDDSKQDLPEGIDKRQFKVVKKGGYDQREVKAYLEDLEQAFRDLELWAQRTKDRLVLAEMEAERARYAEDAAVENAMSAVFDAKDRILQRAHEEAGRIEQRALSGQGAGSSFTPLAGDEAERLRLQAEQLLADAERRADAMIAAAEMRLTDAREKTAEAERILERATETAGPVDGEESIWAASAQQEQVIDLRRRLELAQNRITELEESQAPEQVVIDRANEEAEAIISAAQQRSSELLHQAQAAMTMPGGDAIANAEERAASIIAEAEARARQIEEAVQGIKTQAETEVQLVRDEADRLQAEADRARADASDAVGRLEAAHASYANAREEAEDLRAQLARARSEIDELRNSPEVHQAPDRPPAPPVTAQDAADGIVSPPQPALGSVVAAASGRESKEDRQEEDAALEEAVRQSFAQRKGRPRPLAPSPPEPQPDPDDDLDGELSASERLRMAAQKLRRDSGVEESDTPLPSRGSRYEKRSAGLPRIGAQASDFGGLRSRLSKDGRGGDEPGSEPDTGNDDLEDDAGSAEDAD